MPNQITRRQFLKASALTGAVAFLSGCATDQRSKFAPYVDPPEQQVTGVATWYASTCRMCPAGCGILVRVMNGRALKIEGNPAHPLNQGKLCARGQAGVQLLYNPDRVPFPQQRQPGATTTGTKVDWPSALKMLTDQIGGAGAGVAAWLGSSISGHVFDLFSRIITANGGPPPLVFDLYTGINGYRALAGASNAVYGANALPAYDITRADVVLSVGSNFLGPGTSQVRYNIDYAKFRSQPYGKRGFLIQIEPRQTITGAKADRWLAVKPGTEGIVAQALARIISDQNLGGDRAGRAKTLAGGMDPAAAAQAAGVSPNDLFEIARIFASAAHPVAIAGAPLAGMANGDQAAAAVEALNVIAGANPIAQSPVPNGPVKPTPGTFQDAANLIGQMNSGAIKVLLVYGANPAYDLPPAMGFEAAVKKVPLVVSLNPMLDETGTLAHLLLPVRTYLEEWGYEVVAPNFGTPIIGAQQPVVGPSPYVDSMAVGDALLNVARANGKLSSAIPQNDEMSFIQATIGGLPAGATGGSGADVLWARFLQYGGWWQNPASAPAPTAKLTAAPNVGQAPAEDQNYPYALRIFPQDLLTDGRGANLPWLQGVPDPMTTVSWQTWIEIHPNTAAKLKVKDGDVVTVESAKGKIEAIVYEFPAIREDTVAIPLGQGHTAYGRYAKGMGANAMALVGGELSGATVNWSNLRVKITPTGRSARLARFENATGVKEGFPNAPFPGQ